MLRGTEVRIGTGFAVEQTEADEVDEAQDGGGPEGATPTEVDDRERHQRRADDIGELRGGIEDGGGERPLRTREPIAGGRGVGGERRRFRDAKQHSGGDQATKTAGHGGECGGYRPEGQYGQSASPRSGPKPSRWDL